MEQLGNEIADPHVVDVKLGGGGQAGHLVEIFGRHVPPLKFDDRVDRGPRRERHGPELDRLGPFDVDQIVEVLPHVLFQQGSVLVADFVGRSFQMEHRIAIDPFQPTLAAAGDRFGPGGQRGREQKAASADRPATCRTTCRKSDCSWFRPPRLIPCVSGRLLMPPVWGRGRPRSGDRWLRAVSIWMAAVSS